MDSLEQIDAFKFDLAALVDRYLAEFDLPVETIIGVVESYKIEMLVDPPGDFPLGPCEWDDDYEPPEDENPFLL